MIKMAELIRRNKELTEQLDNSLSMNKKYFDRICKLENKKFLGIF